MTVEVLCPGHTVEDGKLEEFEGRRWECERTGEIMYTARRTVFECCPTCGTPLKVVEG